MFEAAPCTDTISIARAIIFGANGACINIGLGSLLGGIALFVGCVLVLRFIGSALIRRAVPSLRRTPPPTEMTPQPEPAPTADPGLQRLPYESPIRSTGAWGGEKR